MLEDDFRDIARQVPPISLDDLERDVWRDVDAKTRASRVANLIAAWQVGVIAVVLLTGVAGGSIASHAQFRSNPPLDAFSPGIELAPSTRLLRGHP